MPRIVLALNAGSSSLKFSATTVGEEGQSSLLLKGEIEDIGSAPHFVLKDAQGTVLAERRWTDSETPMQPLLEEVAARVREHLTGDELTAIGHRVVHGGPDHMAPERVTPALIASLEKLTPIAPLHIPHNLALIRSMMKLCPDVPQVACFDTAFHRTMPAVARRFALPTVYEAAGVRRYGFHGLSYEYIARKLETVAPHLAKGQVIVAHLGNGASLCALQAGQSLDTTMGFSPLDGLVMGTRCGALDPAIVLYLENQFGLSVDAVRHLLYRESGLLALSGGVANDMRTLLASAEPKAHEAVEIFVHVLARQAGGLIASLQGLDGFVFTAGIGEHASEIRAMVCGKLAWLGVKIDPQANLRHADVISTPDSAVEVRVIPTDEDAMIVRHTLAVLGDG
ncbi:acetate/propionate family kinase [Acetobacter estunensis]|uniref:acetate/propionate family kinase n=1 Tax=Acetobacter estunensis TaxID=104097 RepID=UPI001C2CE6F0|nr:acetate/propionate family kinase [Acetobacter estunensis]MBV1836204.1 acetate/propionate family kinase [Acetobacter estunensis]